MGSELMKKALYKAVPGSQEISPTAAKLLLLAYAEAANEDGTNSFPGPERLEQLTGLKKRAVVRIRQHLIDVGALVPENPHRRGRQKYKLTVNLNALADLQLGPEPPTSDEDTMDRIAQELDEFIKDFALRGDTSNMLVTIQRHYRQCGLSPQDFLRAMAVTRQRMNQDLRANKTYSNAQGYYWTAIKTKCDAHKRGDPEWLTALPPR